MSFCPMELAGPQIKNDRQSSRDILYGRRCVGAQGFMEGVIILTQGLNPGLPKEEILK